MVAFAKRSKRFDDPVGNRTVLNALPDVLTTSTYDAANQKKRDTDLAGGISTFVYDPAGNFSRIVGQPVTFTWDYENRLSRLQSTDETGYYSVTHSYDPDHLRVKTNTFAVEASFEERFAWDGQVLLRHDHDLYGVPQDFTAEPQGYGKIVSGNFGGFKSWFHYDAVGTNRCISKPNGNIRLSRLFTAFGIEATDRPDYTFFPDVAFVGELGYQDTGSNFVYVRRRWYSPESQMWWSRDPWRQPAISSYAYGMNSPMVMIDPSGLIPGTGDLAQCEGEGWTCWMTLKVRRVVLFRAFDGDDKQRQAFLAHREALEDIFQQCCIRIVFGEDKAVTENDTRRALGDAIVKEVPNDIYTTGLVRVESIDGDVNSTFPPNVDAVDSLLPTVNDCELFLVYARELYRLRSGSREDRPGERSQLYGRANSIGGANATHAILNVANPGETAPNANVPAHEIGHLLGLPHVDDPASLMFGQSSGQPQPKLTSAECCIMRSSLHTRNKPCNRC